MTTSSGKSLDKNDEECAQILAVNAILSRDIQQEFNTCKACYWECKKDKICEKYSQKTPFDYLLKHHSDTNAKLKFELSKLKSKSESKSDEKVVFNFPRLNTQEVDILLHITGMHECYYESGISYFWKNYGNYHMNNQACRSLEDKKLLQAVTAHPNMPDHVIIWKATEYGKQAAMQLFWFKYGKKIIKNLRRKLKAANGVLYGNGLKIFPEKDI